MSADDADSMHRISDDTVASVDEVLRYARERVLYADVPLDGPRPEEELRSEVGETITAEGIGAARATRLFADVLAPACLSVDHPGYLSFIPSAPSRSAIAFDLIVSASAIYGGSWLEGAGAVHAENETLRWLSAEFGLPESSGGAFVQGGTIGNLSALVTARDAARARRRSAGLADPDRWRIVCSAEAHSSVASAARIMDVDVIPVPTGDDGRLHGAEVAAALDVHPDSVMAVVATAGTTNFGIVDDLWSISEVTRSRGVWLHVDGAYGLAAMLVPSVRPAFRGVEHADSLIVDPHKWLFAPFDACALIYRDPAHARRAHTQEADYLEVLKGPAQWNPSDLAVHLTRRARGLPLWFSVASHGIDAYRAAIEHGITMAAVVADEIRRRPELSLVRDPQLSVVVFRREGWRIDDYQAWSDRLLDEQVGFVVPSYHHGEPVLRFAIINPLTTADMLIGILDTLS